MKILCLILLLLAVPAMSQTTIHGKVSINADGEAYKAIRDGLKKRADLVVTDNDDAEIVIAYKTINRGVVPPSGMTLETGEMIVTDVRNAGKTVLWRDSLTGGGFKGDAAKKLLQKFLKFIDKQQGK